MSKQLSAKETLQFFGEVAGRSAAIASRDEMKTAIDTAKKVYEDTFAGKCERYKYILFIIACIEILVAALTEPDIAEVPKQ